MNEEKPILTIVEELKGLQMKNFTDRMYDPDFWLPFIPLKSKQITEIIPEQQYHFKVNDIINLDPTGSLRKELDAEGDLFVNVCGQQGNQGFFGKSPFRDGGGWLLPWLGHCGVVQSRDRDLHPYRQPEHPARLAHGDAAEQRHGADCGTGSTAVSLASAELYNPATGTFTTTGSLNTARVQSHGDAAEQRHGADGGRR